MTSVNGAGPQRVRKRPTAEQRPAAAEQVAEPVGEQAEQRAPVGEAATEVPGDGPVVETLRLVVSVVAGLIPGGEPMPELSRRWGITSAQWQAAAARVQSGEDNDAVAALLAEVNGRAVGYASLLMLQPQRLNWVRTDWVYL